MQTVGMLLAKGWFQKVVDLLLGFAAIIPQTIYFLYASMVSLLDLLQYMVRKLAGLDVYYVNGVAQEGDIITDFLKGIVGIDKSPAYSALSTVFWSLIIFGVILLILSTIVSIIKAHYNYDANKSHPMTILRGALKSVATMAIVPIVAIFGVYLSQIILRTLDEITAPNESSSISSVYEANAANKFACDDDGTYASYDYFSAGGYTKTSTFSGMLFKIASYNCNRVRSGYYSPTVNENERDMWDNMGVFYASSGSANQHEVIAAQIDYAFANNLHLKEKYSKVKVEGGSESGTLGPSLRWGLSATFSAGLSNVKCFSKYNVGLVFYYYDLWAFNAIIGFAGALLSLTMLGNIVFGLMARLLQVVALFIIYPAFIGIMPLDDGNAFTQWRKQFTSDILMAFGAVVGMNIFFLILPYFNTISFFNEAFLDGIVNMIIVIAGLTLVKKFISLVSKFVGTSDANEMGAGVRSDAAQAAMKGATGTLKAAGVAGGIAKPMFRGAAALTSSAAKKIGEVDAQNREKRALTKSYNKNLKDGQKAKKFKELTDEDKAFAQQKLEEQRANKAAGKAEKAYQNKYGAKNDPASKAKDEQIKKFFGMDENAELTAEDREQYANYKSLDKEGRKAIMAGAVEKGEDGEEHALTGDKLTSYLQSQLGGRGADDAGKAVWANHNVASLNRKSEKKYRRAQTVGSIFGQDTSKYKQGAYEIDEETGDVKQTSQGTGVLKGVGQAMLDLSQTSAKTIASLTGVEAAWKKLGEGGVIDGAKSALQSLTGITPGDGGVGKVLQTKGQKGKSDEEELKAMRKSQLEEQKLIAQNTANTKKAIDDLAKALSSKRTGTQQELDDLRKEIEDLKKGS